MEGKAYTTLVLNLIEDFDLQKGLELDFFSAESFLAFIPVENSTDSDMFFFFLKTNYEIWTLNTVYLLRTRPKSLKLVIFIIDDVSLYLCHDDRHNSDFLADWKNKESTVWLKTNYTDEEYQYINSYSECSGVEKCNDSYPIFDANVFSTLDAD